MTSNSCLLTNSTNECINVLGITGKPEDIALGCFLLIPIIILLFLFMISIGESEGKD